MEKTQRKKTGRGVTVLLCILVVCFGGIAAACGELSDGRKPPATEAPDTERQETPSVTNVPDNAAAAEITSMPEEALTKEMLESLLEDMTLEEKVGQMFLVRCPEDAVAGIVEYKVGGYVLFADDFEEEIKESMSEKLNEYQKASKLPLLFAVDEEGGTVVRISRFSAFRETAFLSPRELYQSGGLERIVEDTREKAELLLSLGINVNLAPVCDISQDTAAFMYARSFGGTAEETAAYVTTVVTIMEETGLGSVLKHFPGYGNNADTHEGIVYDIRTYETYQENDFKPFLAGIEAGAGAVMVSHNIIKCMDAGQPASLSARVHQILREELAFDGVILTDDLHMDAIQDFMGTEAAAVAAVLAGNDMLCCTDFEVQIPAVLEAVRDGRISEERIDASVLRILKWKAELGILNE